MAEARKPNLALKQYHAGWDIASLGETGWRLSNIADWQVAVSFPSPHASGWKACITKQQVGSYCWNWI